MLKDLSNHIVVLMELFINHLVVILLNRMVSLNVKIYIFWKSHALLCFKCMFLNSFGGMQFLLLVISLIVCLRMFFVEVSLMRFYILIGLSLPYLHGSLGVLHLFMSLLQVKISCPLILLNVYF